MGRQGPRHLGERLLRPREVVQIDQFLKETAAREASAKLRLQQFIEELLERADRAERQLQVISSSCGSTPSASLGRGGGGGGAGPGPRGPGRMVSVHLPSLLHLHPCPLQCHHVHRLAWCSPLSSVLPFFGSSLQAQGTGVPR